MSQDEVCIHNEASLNWSHVDTIRSSLAASEPQLVIIEKGDLVAKGFWYGDRGPEDASGLGLPDGETVLADDLFSLTAGEFVFWWNDEARTFQRLLRASVAPDSGRPEFVSDAGEWFDIDDIAETTGAILIRGEWQLTGDEQS